MRARIIEISVFSALIITVIISVCTFESGCANVRENVLRLHVIANSDTESDQQLKLKVRDAVLEAGKNVFGVSENASDAACLIEENSDILLDAARAEIEKNGYTYSVSIAVCNDYFPTRTYNQYTLPAGEYTAVRVIIGEGSGHNWWCVMFPPLCLPAAESKVEPGDVLSSHGLEIVTSSPKYELRFKIVEWIESLRQKRS